MKIALIGGSGFVGTHLIEQFYQLDMNELLNIDKAPSEKYDAISKIGDVLDKDLLVEQLRGADIVILLAAEHRDDVTPVSRYYDVNVEGMKNTLAAMEANAVKRLVFVSSVAIYGLDKDNPDESTPPDPFNHYGISKWQAEQVLQKWYSDHQDWNINIVRPSVIFGERNRGNVYNLFRQIASGKFSDSKFSNRLANRFLKVIQSDMESARGERILKAQNLVMLQDLECNDRAKLGDISLLPITLDYDRLSGDGTLECMGLIPHLNIAKLQGATHVRHTLVLQEFSGEDSDQRPVINRSTYIALRDAAPMNLQLTATLQADVAKSVLLLAGMEYFQLVNGAYYPLSNGRYNALTIKQVYVP